MIGESEPRVPTAENRVVSSGPEMLRQEQPGFAHGVVEQNGHLGRGLVGRHGGALHPDSGPTGYLRPFSSC